MKNRRINIRFTLQRDNILALILLLAAGWGLLIFNFSKKHTSYQHTPPVNPSRIQSAQQLVNPNKDSLASLVRLKGIGPNRAKKIIEYRDAHSTTTKPAFEKLSDMERVKGLGPLTVIQFKGKTALPEK